MRTCQSCGRENPDDRDFCECGEYLRWEPTGYMQAVTADQAAAAAPPGDGSAPAGDGTTSAATQPAAVPPPPPPAPATHEPAAAPAAYYPPPAAPPPAPAAPAYDPNAAAAYAPPPPAPVAAPASYPPPATPAGAQPASAPVPTAVHGTPAVPPPPAYGAPPAPAAPPAPEEPQLATISLRTPDAESASDDPLVVEVNPGQQAQFIAQVRNSSTIVDNYELVIRGLDPSWYTIVPDTVYLVPFGTAGTYEQDVQIMLHPPRAPDAEAKQWHLQLQALSKAYERIAAHAPPIALDIKPYEEYDVRVKPERASGRRGAKYDVALRNKANAPVLIALGLNDPDSSMAFFYREPQVEVPAGETVTTQLEVKPPKKIWVGRAKEHRLEVLAKTGEAGTELLAEQGFALTDGTAPPDYGEEHDEYGGGLDDEEDDGGGKRKRGKKGKAPKGFGAPKASGPRMSGGIGVGPSGVRLTAPRVTGPRVTKPRAPSKNLNLSSLKAPKFGGGGGGAAPVIPTGPLLPTQAIYRQKPFLPWWTWLFLLLLLLLLLAFFFLLPKNVIVPDLTKAKTNLEAQELLAEKELSLNPKVEEVVNKTATPGTILGQAPKAGAKVKKNTMVAIQVAIGDGNVTVPKVVGLTVADAEKALRAAKLSLGAVSPAADPKGKIASQLPAENETAKEGEPVNVFLVQPKDGKGGEDGKGGGGAGGGGGGGGGEGAKIAVPAIGDNDVEAYAALVSEKGLVPESVKAFSDKARVGVLFDTIPEGGTEVEAGSTVKMLVSAGVPALAFDDDRNVKLVNGANGKEFPAIAKKPQVEKDPTWSATGSHVAYVRGRQLMLVEIAKLDEKDRKPTVLTGEKDEFSDPAFAPSVEINTLAAARKKGNDTDLCIGEVGKEWERSCITEPSFAIGSVIRWAPDGKAIYSLGFKIDQAGSATGVFGIVRWTSKEPFSATAEDWGTAKFVTDTTQNNRGAIDLAISPDGKRMAVVANFDTFVDVFRPGFQLLLTTPDDFELAKAKTTQVPACKAAWRSDSLELITVTADNCNELTVGTLVRVNANDPKDTTSLKVGGDNPAFRPPVPEK